MAKDYSTRDAAAHLPLKPIDFQVLLVLAYGRLHGYGIMKEVAAQSGGSVRLEIGSLYRMIDRLLRGGLIKESGNSDAKERRRYYRLTRLGRRVAHAETQRLTKLLHVASTRNILSGPEEA